MRIKLFLVLSFMTLSILSSQAQGEDGRYIEVTGTSEVEIVPDEIHYIIEIKEYFKEEFDGVSKPEEFRTKVPLSRIEQDLRSSLRSIGITEKAIRTQEVGDYWRERGRDFLIAKNFDITLKDLNQIDKIIKKVNTKGINSMRIGELKNKDMETYREQGKIKALQAAQRKAAYLVEAAGKKLGDVIRIVEPQEGMFRYSMPPQSNVRASEVASFDTFRTIKLNYSMLVRFEITDK
ncbi:SIMPL domain-containing protein [Parabacteroides sp. AM08-6]|uniref:SIMPL domain-containing protein n=1 Tax=Parabacteroides sp. AM08-6 TaxID=2292053 RepID=UPI000EFF102F|nr:SIMPL domain-containing protein [Parabacteroides sp. AM08-6]RHJ77913.1 DUF541 domain-containing protein [Parabacteroides sp. AM08-6]